MLRLSLLALLAACTLRVEMEVRTVPAPQGSAYTSPEQHAVAPADAGVYAYFATPFAPPPNYGLTVNGDAGVSSLSIAIGGCESEGATTNDAGEPCESRCFMPTVNCWQWSAMRYDGCHWRCALLETNGAMPQ